MIVELSSLLYGLTENFPCPFKLDNMGGILFVDVIPDYNPQLALIEFDENGTSLAVVAPVVPVTFRLDFDACRCNADTAWQRWILAVNVVKVGLNCMWIIHVLSIPHGLWKVKINFTEKFGVVRGRYLV